jgi:hypothetical protein
MKLGDSIYYGMLNVVIEVPTEWDEDKDKFLIKSAKVQAKVMEFLKSKGVNLDDNAAKPWSEETKAKVEKIIDILSGKEVSSAKSRINSAATSTSSSRVEDTDLDDDNGDDLDDFFGSDEDEE